MRALQFGVYVGALMFVNSQVPTSAPLSLSVSLSLSIIYIYISIYNEVLRSQNPVIEGLQAMKPCFVKPLGLGSVQKPEPSSWR